MTDQDKFLQIISDKLQSKKYAVNIMDSKLIVSLPMFCSVTAQFIDKSLSLSSKFGKLNRATASTLTLLISALIIGFSFISISGPVLVIFAIGGIVWDVIRWKKTQKVIDEVSHHYNSINDTQHGEHSNL